MWLDFFYEAKRHRVPVAEGDGGIWVGWPGGATLVRESQDAVGGGQEAEGDILAPMTGRVVLVEVAPGDDVAGQQLLVTLEAMKMEYRLTAPRPGKVDVVTCKQGDLVDLGDLLVKLRP